MSLSPSCFLARSVARATVALILPLVVAASISIGAPSEVKTPPPESGFSAERIQRLDQVIDEAIAKKQIAGAIMLLKRDGKDVYLKTYGQQDIEAGKPMRTDTIFRIASMSKAITTIGALMLYEEGKFMLHDPVGKYIPAFKKSLVAIPAPAGSPANVKFITVEAKRAITIRDLMTHTSGLSYGWSNPAKELNDKAKLTHWYFGDHDETIGEAMERLATLPLAAQPGEAFTYGYSTDLLGYLIEVISGQPLDKYLEERIFKPLGMTDTCFYLPPEKADRFMPLYGLEGGKLVLKETAATSDNLKGPRKCFSGGAGLLSTVNDYGRVLQMLLNGGELDGVRILSPKTVELMHQNHVGKLYNSDADGFGLGFWVNNDLGHFGELGSVGSYGWGSAYFPQYFIDPKERLIGLFMTQLNPAGDCDLNQKFKVLTYQALIK